MISTTGADFIVLYDYSMIGLQPCTDAAREWVDANVSSEPYEWLGPVLWMALGSMSSLILHAIDVRGFKIDVH